MRSSQKWSGTISLSSFTRYRLEPRAGGLCCLVHLLQPNTLCLLTKLRNRERLARSFTIRSAPRTKSPRQRTVTTPQISHMTCKGYVISDLSAVRTVHVVGG